MILEVIVSGPRTSIEAPPRFHLAHQGISAGGPADPLAARIANRLVDNRDDASVLEMTLAGATFLAHGDLEVAVSGAPLPIELDGDLRSMNERFVVSRGQTLRLGVTTVGVRTVLAARGGLLSSGAESGDCIKAGDRILIANEPAARDRAAERIPTLTHEPLLRVTPGPDGAVALDDLSFLVTPAADRRGVKLKGSIPDAPASPIITHGVSCGAVQMLPSTDLVILGVDQQTTGGYPVIATVASVDRWKIGQLRPGDRLRFQTISFDAARQALRGETRVER